MSPVLKTIERGVVTTRLSGVCQNRKMKNPKGCHTRELECFTCRAMFVRIGKVGARSFCSQFCYHISNKKEANGNWRGGSFLLKCNCCGEPMRVERNQIQRGEGKFCSRHCARALQPRRPKRPHRSILPEYQKRLHKNMGRAMWQMLKTKKDGRKWKLLAGYGLSELMSRLESLFTDGMSWENYGRNGWHVDHIIPITAFHCNSTDDKDWKACWAIENLQPMWEAENIRKGGANKSKVSLSALGEKP